MIDSHAYLQSLQAVAERHGAQLALDTRVDRLERHRRRLARRRTERRRSVPVARGLVVNAGGLFAQALAQRTEGLDPRQVPALHLCQGATSPTAAARRSATWSTRCPRRAPPGSASTPPSTSAASCASVPT
ncbi:FAD-dependent oxidoreductase [Pseudomonas aeruginosa]